MSSLDLLKDNEKKVFYHYLIPSICSTLVNSIYILVDTLIIGQGVGAEGISALNIFLPFYSIYMGIGLPFGLAWSLAYRGIRSHSFSRFLADIRLILLYCPFTRWQIRSFGLRISRRDGHRKNIMKAIMRKCCI